MAMAGAAFDPYQIAPTAKLPADFEEFWNAQKAELAKVPIDAKVAPVPQDNPNIELFEVSFANIDGQRSHGYLAKPKMDQTEPPDQSVFRDQRQRGEDSNLDFHHDVRTRSDNEEKTEPKSTSIKNTAYFRIRSFERTSLQEALYENDAQKIEMDSYKPLSLFDF